MRLRSNGVELFVEKPVELFREFHIELVLPGEDSEDEEIICTGVAVDCEPVDSRFRIRVQFIDLPDHAVGSLKEALATALPA